MDRVIQRGLDLASAMVSARDREGAIGALEDALAVIHTKWPSRPVLPESWRLESVLAMLYQTAGKTDHARRLARLAHIHACQSGDLEATARMSDLLAKLVPGSNRLARGSQSPMRPRGPYKY